MKKILCFLECPDNRSPRSLDDTQDMAFLTAVAPRASVEPRLPDQARHHAITVQGRSKIFGGDEEVFSSLVLSQHMTRAAGMNLQLAGEEIGCLR
jgi:hypothetical protein